MFERQHLLSCYFLTANTPTPLCGSRSRGSRFSTFSWLFRASFSTEKYFLQQSYVRNSLFNVLCFRFVSVCIVNQKTGFEGSARSSTLTLFTYVHIICTHHTLSPSVWTFKPRHLYLFTVYFDISSSWLYVRDPSVLCKRSIKTNFCAYTLSPHPSFMGWNTPATQNTRYAVFLLNKRSELNSCQILLPYWDLGIYYYIGI